MKRMLSAIVLVVGLMSGLAIGITTSSSAGNKGQWVPPPKTVVAVSGDKANGFSIHHYDGTSLHPPTDSEAFAECGEYDTRVKVVRCRTEVRVWYRELGKMKRALRYAWSVHMAP